MAATFIPAWAVPDASVDWEAEIVQCLGAPLRWGSQDIPPPTLGAMAALEMIDSPYIKDWLHAPAQDMARALAIAAGGSRAVSFSTGWINAGRPSDFADCALDHAAEQIMNQATDADITEAGLLRVHQWFDTAFAGYAMLPKGKGSSSAWLFGAPTLGATVAQLGTCMGVSWHALLWETPVCLLGFATVALARESGQGCIARPKDEAAFRRIRSETKERERHGLIHPWQLEDPRHYPLSAHQKTNPETVALYREAIARHG